MLVYRERNGCFEQSVFLFLWQEVEQTLDYVLDTIPSAHPLEPYLSLLKVNGQLVVLGVVPSPLQFITSMLILGRILYHDSLPKFVVYVASDCLR